MGSYKLKKASQSKTAAKIRQKIGAGPNDVVEVTTPQFDRPRGSKPPPPPPKTRSEWNALLKMTRAQLREKGLRGWDGRLMLFPCEWYEQIPNGLPIEDIFGNKEQFESHVTDNDRRMGYLP